MKRFDQINVIPFIDIMLVLLAIVLTTATFISQGLIEVNLPEASSAEPLQETDLKNLEITINSDNEIFLAGERVDPQNLSQALQKIQANRPVILRVDKRVMFKHFVKVIDLLKKNNLEKFSIVTIENNEQ